MMSPKTSIPALEQPIFRLTNFYLCFLRLKHKSGHTLLVLLWLVSIWIFGLNHLSLFIHSTREINNAGETMKKYRYDDPTKITKGQRLRAYAVFFIGWNLLGYGIWTFLYKNAAARDPEWETRPQDERIALAVGADPKSVKRFHFSFSKQEEKQNKDNEP